MGVGWVLGERHGADTLLEILMSHRWNVLSALVGQVDPLTLGKNLVLIVGGVLGCGVLAVVVYLVATGIKTGGAILRQRRSWNAYLKESRRADGKVYPAFAEGICSGCGLKGDKIYRPASGERLCPECYERYWRGGGDAWSPEDGSKATHPG